MLNDNGYKPSAYKQYRTSSLPRTFSLPSRALGLPRSCSSPILYSLVNSNLKSPQTTDIASSSNQEWRTTTPRAQMTNINDRCMQLPANVKQVNYNAKKLKQKRGEKPRLGKIPLLNVDWTKIDEPISASVKEANDNTYFDLAHSHFYPNDICSASDEDISTDESDEESYALSSLFCPNDICSASDEESYALSSLFYPNDICSALDEDISTDESDVSCAAVKNPSKNKGKNKAKK